MASLATEEDFFIWITASVRQYFVKGGLGLPLTWLQQGAEADVKPNVNGSIELLIHGPNFVKKGSKSEIYADVMVTATLRTRQVDNDLYYHQRILARLSKLMNASIPILKTGDVKYDKSSVGFLKYLQTETIVVGVKEPNASVIDQAYELEIC